MFKKIVPVICALVVSVFGVFSTSFYSYAENSVQFTVNYPEPQCSDTQGYISLLTRDVNTQVLTVRTYFWYCIATNSSGAYSPAYAYIDLNSASIKITVAAGSGATAGFYVLSGITPEGTYRGITSSSSSAWNFNFNQYGLEVVGYKFGGNAQINSGFSMTPFDLFFDSSGASSVLMDVLYTLAQMNNRDQTILQTINSILNSVDGVESQLSSVISYLQSVDSKLSSIESELQVIYDKADDILNEQKKSNTWLEKIFNYLNESAEKQKNEATQQGNNSVSQGTSSIEDKGTGFVDSMGGLVSSMSYSGTDCAWTFPQVKMPAIDGIMEERVLIEEQPIDFTRFINAIPAPILLLIQSVLTMGLIVYCFKELYGTISYVLTLRGGGSNE